MASCAYCNTTILFGGRGNGGLRFCNATCEQKDALAAVASQLPASDVAAYIAQVHRGNCPKCSGPGPVDVHTSYRVWSALILTSWASRPLLGCRKCGMKQKLGDTAFSAILGWWGLPWGIIMTPVQIVRNLFSLAAPPDPSAPSPALEKILRLHLAEQLTDKPGLAGQMDETPPQRW